MFFLPIHHNLPTPPTRDDGLILRLALKLLTSQGEVSITNSSFLTLKFDDDAMPISSIALAPFGLPSQPALVPATKFPEPVLSLFVSQRALV